MWRGRGKKKVSHVVMYCMCRIDDYNHVEQVICTDDSDINFCFLDLTNKTFELVPVVFVRSFNSGTEKRYGWFEVWPSSFHNPNEFGYEFPEVVGFLYN